MSYHQDKQQKYILIMKLFYSLALITLLISCKENKEIAAKANPASQKTNSNSDDAISQSIPKEFESEIRPNEKLKLQQVYTDVAEYMGFNEGGDYSYVEIKKNNKIISLTSNLMGDERPDYTMGDIYEFKWNIDSVFIAGDGERRDFTEWFISAKKVKDGSVSLFRKKHPKPMKYNWSGENAYSTEFKDYLYTQVEYYLANSKSELVKADLEDPNINLVYSIEERAFKGRSYIVLGVAKEFENRTSIMQWLYIDNETRILYEYDLPNEKLVEFK
ncbi:hypothetical protein B0A67_00105 [Flavobacterium aquidurense]|jgi:hypothetical protein|nr:hypothetical protein B0A67_00105 [Flavobacterium aquidurense]SHF89841.1 hypothetical protein SAMN05444481_10121 [Flavobacterium frigidimaris]